LITTHIYTVPGTYDVVLTVATDEGCVDEQSIILNDHVEVFPRPIAGFTVEPDEVSLMDPTITVRDHAQLAEHWEYMIDGITITAPSFEHEFADAGRFEITQVVTSGANCTDALTLTVNVTDHLFYAPNAFTPDGDGVNDTWSPSVLGARSYEVIVHDRLGVERFRSTDPGSVWSGDELPQGVYEYVVRIAEYGAFRKEYRGHVTLLR
jgi:gliding motility-associated-like protein